MVVCAALFLFFYAWETAANVKHTHTHAEKERQTGNTTIHAFTKTISTLTYTDGTDCHEQ